MLQLTPVMEDYLKTIYRLCQDTGVAHSVDVANRHDRTKASVSSVMRMLCEYGLVRKNDKLELSLTPEGRELATFFVERHGVVLDYLRNVLGIDPEIAAKDACRIEHLISEESYQSMRKQIELQDERLQEIR